MKIIIKYRKAKFGPYVIEFDSSSEAESWIRQNEVQIEEITFG